MRPGLALTTFLLAALAGGCGDDTATSPSSTSSTTSTTTVTYTGTLDPGTSRVYSITNAASGTVTALLASVTATDTRLPLAVSLDIGIGVPSGTDCATTIAQPVVPGLVSQLSTSLAAGTFCVRVADTGALTVPATFAVRFTHP